MTARLHLTLSRAARTAASLGSATMLALASLGAQAGVADVSFVDAQRYTDADRAGFGAIERQRTLDALTQHFQALAARLPPDRTLAVQVLDVDLAGELHANGGLDRRVLLGGADRPRIVLRYTLQRGTDVLQRGEADLIDLAYLNGSPLRGAERDQPLPYERRMLQRWFDDQVASAISPARQ